MLLTLGIHWPKDLVFSRAFGFQGPSNNTLVELCKPRASFWRYLDIEGDVCPRCCGA